MGIMILMDLVLVLIMAVLIVEIFYIPTALSTPSSSAMRTSWIRMVTSTSAFGISRIPTGNSPSDIDSNDGYYAGYWWLFVLRSMTIFG